jgi:two-component system LytT family sensor kinase
MLVNILPGQIKNGMEESIMTEASLSNVQSGITLQIQSGKNKELADAYRAIANYYYRKWYNDSLLFFLRKALEQYDVLNDSFHIAYCFMRIGEVFVDGDNDAESLSWTKPAASYFERNGHHQLAAHSFYTLSMAYKKMNRKNICEEYLQKARSFASISKDTLLEIIIIDQQTDQFEVEKKWDEFAAGAEHVLRLSRLIKEPVFIKKGLVDNAKVKLHLEQPQEALIFLNESATMTDGGRTQIPETFRLLVVAHLKLKQFEQAAHYLRLYKQASDSIQLVKEKDSFRDMIAKYESDKKKNMIASLERENTLKEKLAANQRNLIIALLSGLVLISAAGFLYFRNLTNKRKLEKKLLLQEEELQRQKEQKLMAEFNKQLAEVQLTALNAQMNPHFIFNCMNSIQKYILKNEKTKALEFLQNFSELMRSVLDHSAKTKISLYEEINMLEKYVLLEQQRLDNKFEYRIEVDPDLQTDFFEIPGMIIQPYVENAIWHGLMNKVESKNDSASENGLLKLKFSKENGAIKCIIEDNGVGRKKAAIMEKDRSPRHKSYGMAIAKKRFELLQKENEKLPEIKIEDFFSNGDSAGTRVTVYMNVD